MKGTTLFISDLHLESSNPDITNTFLQFLTHQLPRSDSLYILGDLFEVWVGDDDTSEFNQIIKSALKKVTSTGYPIYFMRGNRDLLIGRRFLKETGCLLLKDPCVINLYGKPTLLMHGDSLCTQDTKHMIFRRKAHNKIRQALFLMKSLESRKAMAQQIRQHSKQHTRTAPAHIMDVTPEAVRQALASSATELFIHGHTHRPAFHKEPLTSGKIAQRIVLGTWEQDSHVLLYNADGSYTFQVGGQNKRPNQKKLVPT